MWRRAIEGESNLDASTAGVDRTGPAYGRKRIDIGGRPGQVCIPDRGLLLRRRELGGPTIDDRGAMVGDGQIGRVTPAPGGDGPSRGNITGFDRTQEQSDEDKHTGESETDFRREMMKGFHEMMTFGLDRKNLCGGLTTGFN